MNIIERGRQFLDSLGASLGRSAWDWRRCPSCGDTLTCKWGTYRRHPWTLQGRQTVRVQRHKCYRCERTYAEHSALYVRGGWYAREVRRAGIDSWVHLRTSYRRGAEWLRSVLGQQERWQVWCPWQTVPAEAARCHLSASTLHRWVDGAGQQAQATLPQQWAGVPTSGQVGVDGLWARLRGKTKRVVLLLVDTVTGVRWPAVVVTAEHQAGWLALLRRAHQAGLELDALRGIVSDGATGLVGALAQLVGWVNHQRCVFHVWRSLRPVLGAAVQAALHAQGLTDTAAETMGRTLRQELVGLVHGVLDAPHAVAALAAVANLAAHPAGAALAAALTHSLETLFLYQCAYNQGLTRVVPEWVWRDFRLRLSRGRNHQNDVRLERAALLWVVYTNFEPAQWRSERKRRYRRPGQSPLAMAGVPPGPITYLDALAV